MSRFTVYILHSDKHSKYYIGQTSDLTKRLEWHNHLSSHSYTAKYRPWYLATKMNVSSRSEAIRIEKYLKRKNRVFIERLIKDADLRKHILSRFKNQNVGYLPAAGRERSRRTAGLIRRSPAVQRDSSPLKAF